MKKIDNELMCAVGLFVTVKFAESLDGRIATYDELGISRLHDALTFYEFKTRRVGPDIIFDGVIAKWPAIQRSP